MKQTFNLKQCQKTTKFLGINLAKGMQDLYTKAKNIAERNLEIPR